MSIRVSNIKHSHNTTVFYKQPKYAVDANLKETVLGQEKDYEETFLLPDVLNVKIAAIFNEVEEYIENSREGKTLHVRLEICKDEKTVGCHIYYGNEKITAVRVVNDLYKKSKDTLAFSTIDQIADWCGWSNKGKQKLVLNMNEREWDEEVVAAFRRFTNIEVREVDNYKEG